MNILLERFRSTPDATLGRMLCSGKRYYTLEDEKREVKMKGETRIPAGKYQIKFRQVLSPLTMRYRRRFKWFSYHLELQNVPGFQYVYIHIGNDDDDTDGCILVGLDAYPKVMKIGNSTNAFEAIYKAISKALNEGEKVTIDIYDEDNQMVS